MRRVHESGSIAGPVGPRIGEQTLDYDTDVIKKRLSGLAALALVGLWAVAADAQVFTPTFMSPQRSADVGVYLSDGPGDFSVEGIWRRNLGTYDLGFRAGIADVRGLVVLVGAEFRTPLDVADAPVDVALVGGVQGAFGDRSAAGFQGGVTIGVPVTEGSLTFVPYIHPRLAILSNFGREDFDLDPLADIGFDLLLPQNLRFRVGFGLGRPTARWGVGFSW
jgi:hypothetical protein